MIQRYYWNPDYILISDEHGEIYKTSDYLAEIAEKDKEIQRLTAEIEFERERANKGWKLHQECHDVMEPKIERLTASNARLREALEWLVNDLKAVHDDPEYQCVWTLYQSHVPTGYRGRKYTAAFDNAQTALGEKEEGK